MDDRMIIMAHSGTYANRVSLIPGDKIKLTTRVSDVIRTVEGVLVGWDVSSETVEFKGGQFAEYNPSNYGVEVLEYAPRSFEPGLYSIYDFKSPGTSGYFVKFKNEGPDNWLYISASTNEYGGATGKLYSWEWVKTNPYVTLRK